MEWLSIGDVTVAVAASLGTSSSEDNCLLISTMRAKAASPPPHCCKVWMSALFKARVILLSSSVSADAL